MNPSSGSICRVHSGLRTIRSLRLFVEWIPEEDGDGLRILSASRVNTNLRRNHTVLLPLSSIGHHGFLKSINTSNHGKQYIV